MKVAETRAIFSDKSNYSLHDYFEIQPYLTKKVSERIQERFGLSANEVKKWFRNERNKRKKLKGWCDVFQCTYN